MRTLLNQIAATAPSPSLYPAFYWDIIEQLLQGYPNATLIKYPNDIASPWNTFRATFTKKLDHPGEHRNALHTMAKNMQDALKGQTFEVSLDVWDAIAFPPGVPHARKIVHEHSRGRDDDLVPLSLFMTDEDDRWGTFFYPDTP